MNIGFNNGTVDAYLTSFFDLFIIGVLIWALRSWKTEQTEAPAYRIHQVHRHEVM